MPTIRPPGRALAITVALLAVPAPPVLAGCGGSGERERAAASSAPASPARTLSPVELCTQAVVYWTGEMLDAGSDTGLDYQSMGLSDSQYRIVRDLYAEARKGGGKKLVEREAPRRCRDSARAERTESPRGGWPG
jgi:hypothetical protein